jgi:putative transposase
MAVRDDEVAARTEQARAIGLFRYQLIREPADPGLSTKARGRLVREIAAREHLDPAGRRRRISRDTLDRWIRAWRRGGFDALVPDPRQSSPRLPVEVIEMAVSLKRENPARTAAQVRRILRAQMGWSPGERTLQRHFAEDPQIAAILGALAAGGPGSAGVSEAVFGRFEADRPNELWTGDALHGPSIGGRKTYLFAFLDDHSRAIVGHRFGFAEDAVRLAAALRPALGSRGVPDAVYVDNGSAFVDAWLLRACAKLGIRLIHSTPGRPQGRGKIERFFRTVREQFLVEITGDPERDPNRHTVGDLDELNRLFTAWVETVYHRREHSETGAPPLARWHAGGPFVLPTPEALAEAFLWEAHRTVTKTALVSLQGNT